MPVLYLVHQYESTVSAGYFLRPEKPHESPYLSSTSPPPPSIVEARLMDPATLLAATCQLHRELLVIFVKSCMTVAIQPAYAKQVSPSLQVSADRVRYRCLMSAAAFDSRHHSPLSALVGAASVQVAPWVGRAGRAGFGDLWQRDRCAPMFLKCSI
ncbi:hypothetical protein R3P38DRAFT_2809178 [Favolaschia claudopus]|uniref:Uncharacterized protein n=1 Tax=Favolaschia claudopus TaxID=2862362 RepID=A0AAV9ZDN2_9AGAR